MSTTEVATHTVQLTEAAVVKAKQLREREGGDHMKLRLAVEPGGCSGLTYKLFLDEEHLAGDTVVGFDGLDLVVDEVSAPYVVDATVDFEDTFEKQGFTIDNPSAVGGCACGDSFC